MSRVNLSLLGLWIVVSLYGTRSLAMTDGLTVNAFCHSAVGLGDGEKFRPYTPEELKFLRSQPREVILSRFFRVSKMWSSARLAFQEIGEQWLASGGYDSKMTPDAELATFFELQTYSLNKMQETQYLPSGGLGKYLELSTRLDQGQIAFVESVRSVPSNWSPKVSQEFGDARWADRYGGDIGSGRDRRTAAMWSVSGQAVDTQAAMIRSTALPWQLEPKFKDLLLDRARFRYVWEWGRAGQDVPGESEPLRKVLATATLQELLALGGDVSQAFVMFHSLDKANSILYDKLFPGRRFPSSGSVAEGEALYLVPLSEILSSFSPGSGSIQLDTLARALDRKADFQKVAKLHSSINDVFYQELDLASPAAPRNRGPLAFCDYSHGKENLLFRLLSFFGISKEKAQIIDEYMRRFRANYSTHDPTRYQDVSDPPALYHQLQPRRVVEISNLDAQAIKSDPKYLKRVLFSLFQYYARKLAFPRGDQAAVDYAVAQIFGEKIQFALSTFNADLAKQISALGPSEVIRYRAPSDLGVNAGSWQPADPTELKWRIHHQPIQVHIFTPEQIVSMIRADPMLGVETQQALRPGVWQATYSVQSLDIY